jgi:hypothetical protein
MTRFKIITFWSFIKPLVRTTLDCYILPGTVTGTEICWLYLLQWKKEVSTISLALVSVLFSQINLPYTDAVISNHSVGEQENVM